MTPNNGLKFATVVVLSIIFPASVLAQENLGTSFGIPNSSPGVLWPRGSSLESLGFGRLYPNGPEFGLGNTSGGFGVTGSGRLSGVGLAEREVAPLVREQMERPYVGIQRLQDAFGSESARAASLFSSPISEQFRSQLRVGSTDQTSDFQSGARALPQTFRVTDLPSVDSVLHDRPATSNDVLKTGP